ncbi:hypothetical protein ZYGR_0AI06300 [Zygosaccharomyces rouxii]|uniref:RNB domain-containing protein n=1 Tax=Zygosaccharomyces rouxii TaxID=4956 RepID=A0A1Q3AC41_ZYGRO|nr:hypothetical protein ZYGR_0AI06300 [Zygosaccharomyces rouxii]
MSQIFTRRLHLSQRCLRHFKKPRRVSRTSSKEIGSAFAIPERAILDPPTPLSQKDIDRINYMFLSRTKDLEPGVEVKDLNRIKQEFYSRYGARYLNPCNSWFHRSEQNILGKSFSRSWINAEPESLGLKNKGTLKFDARELMSRPLQTGDLVLLKYQSLQLCMCIDVPSSTRDPRYTFTTVDGTIIFSTRNMVLMRIPYNLPKVPLLMKEMKHGFEPVGCVKNTTTETFILPIVPRQQITSPICHQISKKAWEEMPFTLKKLELLHRHLQDAQGPWQVPFMNLVSMVERLDMRLASASNTGAPYVEDLIRTCTFEPLTKLDSAVFLSVYCAIENQQQSHLWGDIHSSKALLSPVSVTVMPLNSQHLYYRSVLQKLKARNYDAVSNFARLVNTGKYSKAITEFPEIIKLLQDYAAGNFYNDATAISVVSKIFRKIERFQEEDITRDVCHQLLKELDPSQATKNPLHYNLDLGLPVSSLRSTSEQDIYNLARPVTFDKRAEDLRHDFGEMKVYCIDSDTAHEIDDGVSIEFHNDVERTLYIHIADPASFFRECQEGDRGIESEILQIALNKSFTTYLPDLVSPMLPQSYSRAADLGKQGQKARTITFSVDGSWMKNGQFQLKPESFRIKLGLVSNFPQVTYDTVDSILEQTCKLKNGNANLTDDQRNLKELHGISRSLRDSRIRTQQAVVFGSEFNKGQIELSPDENGALQRISFKDQIETPSSVLVSEMMILANTLSGKFFRDNNLPGVFRCYQPLALGPQAENEYEFLKTKIKGGKPLTFKDICMISTLLNSSFYSSDGYRHEMIGAPHYLTVTSPLRRFPDMINHLQIHRFLKGLPLCFNKNDLDRFTWHIQSRDSILKDASRCSNTYWTLKYLKQLVENDKGKKFSVMINSVPQVGLVKCVLPDYSSARATLKIKPNEVSNPVIGDIVENCKITKIDALEGLLEMEL